MIEENDVIFAFSNSGETPELINLLKYSRTKAIIAVSQSKDSLLGNMPLAHLECKVDKKSAPELGSNNEYNGRSSYGRCHLCDIMNRSKFSEKTLHNFIPEAL